LIVRRLVLATATLLCACANGGKPFSERRSYTAYNPELALWSEDGRREPIRLSKNGEFEFPGFPASEKRWWNKQIFWRYRIDPNLPRFCSGRLSGVALEDTRNLFMRIESQPLAMRPSKDTISVISHVHTYRMTVMTSEGMTNQEMLRPSLVGFDSIHETDDWDRQAKDVLSIFERAGLAVEHWKPDLAAVSSLKCR